jgi:hypothetical protein
LSECDLPVPLFQCGVQLTGLFRIARAGSP